MSDKEIKQPTVEELQEQLERIQGEMERVVQIANMYIKAHRDLLTQVRTAVDTSANLEAMLSEKLK